MAQLWLWETEFFAVSVMDGKIKSYRGIFIQADTLPNAVVAIRNMKLDYLQLTGEKYLNFEQVIMDDKFHDKLGNISELVKDMDFDEFSDWLELALTKEDLLKARRTLEKEVGLEKHIKIIDAYIKRYEEKGESDKEEDDEESKEEMG